MIGNGCIRIAQIVLFYIGDVGLSQTDIGSQLFDITLSEWIHINPLFASEKVIHRLEVDTLWSFRFKTGSYGKVFNRCIAVVEVDHTLLDVVVATFYDIACRSIRIVDVFGIVGSIECIPVDLGSIVVAASPEINQSGVGIHIDGRTYILIVEWTTITHFISIQVFINEITIFVNLTIPKERR